MLQENDAIPRATEPLQCRQKQQTSFSFKLGALTENNKTLLFFSGKKKVQTFNGSI